MHPSGTSSKFATHATMPLALFADVGVEQIIRVALWAMSLLSIDRREATSTKQIHLSRRRFHMLGIHTQAIAAEMVNIKPNRNRTYVHLVRYAVRQGHAAIRKHMTITVAILRTFPKPAVGRALSYDLGPKSFCNWPWLGAALKCHDATIVAGAR